MASNNLSEGFENLCLTGEGPLGAIPKIPNKTETQQNASSPGSNRKAPKKKNRKDRRRSDNEASDSSTGMSIALVCKLFIGHKQGFVKGEEVCLSGDFVRSTLSVTFGWLYYVIL